MSTAMPSLPNALALFARRGAMVGTHAPKAVARET